MTCPYQEYGTTTDKCMGVYCNLTKEVKEIQDCEGCDVVVSKTGIATEKLF